MAIGSVSSNNPLTTSLQAQGLSSDAIKLVETDLDAVGGAVSTDASAASSVDSKAIRAALDQKLSDDVASGKLSQDDADKIGKALDQMDGSSDSEDATDSSESGGAAKAGGPPGGGGGGGGGSTEKTEQSRTVTISGGIKTTVITYTDGTKETKTSIAQDGDRDSKGKTNEASDKKDAAAAGKTDHSGKPTNEAASKADDETAQAYLSQIEPGSLFNAYA